MKKNTVSILITLLMGPCAFAQSLVPATSEDLAAFDEQISNSSAKAPESPKPEHPAVPVKKSKTANFGSVVSQKAKELKNEPQADRKKMGQWVSEQRQKDDEKVPASAQGKGQGLGNGNASKDASTSSPGNSANAPGHSGNHKK
jgi:hypothetical protein